MIIVHYLNNSRAHRILWLLEELGLAYEVKTYQRGPDMRAPASLKAVHPLGKSPVIEDGGRIIAESGAIIEYLVETYGEGKGLKPAAGTDEALRYRYWLHYAEGSASCCSSGFPASCRSFCGRWQISLPRVCRASSSTRSLPIIWPSGTTSLRAMAGLPDRPFPLPTLR